MTRINVVPVEELCDRHLLAELRELTRIPSRVDQSPEGARKAIRTYQPADYVLGRGHVCFFYNRLNFLYKRHLDLIAECHARGFKAESRWNGPVPNTPEFWNDYVPTPKALRINRERIEDRLSTMVRTPTWTTYKKRPHSRSRKCVLNNSSPSMGGCSMAKPAAKGTYSESDIELFRGLEGIRKRPTMYLRERGPQMVFRCVKEIVDNCFDEVMAGRNSLVELYIDPQNKFYIVADGAEGIPVGIHPKAKVSTLTVIFTEIHAGGKFNDNAYAASAGVHGIGASAVNAVSELFEVWTFRDKKWWHQAFSKGVQKYPLKAQTPPASVTKCLKTTGKKGTIIRFIPDQSIVSADGGKTRATLNVKEAMVWLRNCAMLSTGVSVTLTSGEKTKTWINKIGVSHLLKSRLIKEELSPMGKPLIFESKRLSIAVQWTSYPEDDGLHSYVSNSKTDDGGTHVEEFYDALVKSLAPHKLKRDKFAPRDVRNGLVGILNWRMHGPEFSSQVKDKLTSDLKKALFDEALAFFTEFFNANKALARKVIKRAADTKKAKEEIRKIMSSVSDINSSRRGLMLPGILATARKCPASKREIFIVEGDSAAGSAKKARDINFQEVLKLQGKPLNGVRIMMAKLLASKSIQNILAAIGYNHKLADPYAGLRVNHVFLLSDADADGPLEGSTMVLMADMTQRSIRDIHDAVQRGQPMKVWSYERDGQDQRYAQHRVPHSTYAGKCYRYTELKFSDGTVYRCTPNHRWPLTDQSAATLPADQVERSMGIAYTTAQYMAEGMEVISMGSQFADVKSMKLLSKRVVNTDQGVDMYCLTIPNSGNFVLTTNSGRGICTGNSHINSLILSIFYRLLPKMFEQGRVFICDAPLFSAFFKGQLYVGRTNDECFAQLPKGSPRDVIVRAKGWGELAPETLAVIAMNPATRNLIRVKPMDVKQLAEYKAIMGSDSSARKILLGIA